MVQAAAAVIVIERHDERLDRNAVAGLDPGDVLARLDDLRRKLVAENLRQRSAGEDVRRNRRHDRARGKFVQIHPADAAGPWLDPHLLRTDGAGLRGLFDTDVFLPVVADCFHDQPPFARRWPGLRRCSISGDLQRHLHRFLRPLADSSASSRIVEPEVCVWIGDRSMPVRSRKRMADGQTPGEPMQPRTVRFFIWILPSSTGNFWPILMPTIDIAPLLAGVVEDIGERRGVAGRLDDQIGAAAP